MIALDLRGPAYERGLQQASVDPALRAAALSWMMLRHKRVETLLAQAAMLELARNLHAHALDAAPDAMEELRGIADGFGMPPFDMFCTWYAAVLGEAQVTCDGCTAVAIGSGKRAHVAKNRDVPGATQQLQAVFRSSNPDWRGGSILSVSALGSASCASSGINQAGLCIADTQVATHDHGVGLIRYIVMQKLLQECRNVAEALAALRSIRHAGGGTLAIADTGGALAIAELGHRRMHIETARNTTLSRTNHFTGTETANDNLEAPQSAAGIDSRARFTCVMNFLDSRNGHPLPGEIATLLASHDPEYPLCRHGFGTEKPKTISLVLYDIGARSLTITDGPPCGSPSLTYRIETTTQQELIP